ncbi:unannotated protein [freshwater metagenome]|uniref:Unannotated protein n=1 Tax=freshwater metagenome TaxID=449393 RepID=A0A6J7NBX4_9ZZZZ
MGEHDALVDARRARGVREDDEVAGRDRNMGSDRRPEQGGHRLCALGFAEHVDLANRCPGRSGGGQWQERAHGDQEGRAGVDELLSNLRFGVRRVDRRDDAARSRDAVEDDGELGDIRRHEGEDIALLETARDKPSCEGSHGGGETGVGEGATGGAIDERRLVTEFIGAGQDVVGEREIRNLDVGKRAHEHGGPPELGCPGHHAFPGLCRPMLAEDGRIGGAFGRMPENR